MIILSYPYVFAENSNFVNIIKHDDAVIIPGIGAEGILLGENIDELISISSYKNYQVSKPYAPKDLFKNVLKVVFSKKILFDHIYFFEKKKLFIFVLKHKVVAIAGSRDDRITLDSISLAKGVDFFIYNYGNQNCKKIKSAENIIIIYSKIGLAIIDDKSDNSIDMFLVFKIF